MKYEILNITLFAEFSFIKSISNVKKNIYMNRFKLFFKILLIKFKFINKEIRKLLSYILFNYLFFKIYYIDKIMKFNIEIL